MKFVKRYPKTFIQAHRGASGYRIDNTMESFEKAIEFKADSIELDIRRTKDKKIICVHDPLYKDIHINKWEYDNLCSETLKEGYVMPLLIDVLNKCKGKILVDVELKEKGYEKQVIDLILSVYKEDEFYIRSFNTSSLRVIKEYNKLIYTILLVGIEHHKFGILGRIFCEVYPYKKIKESKCSAISPNYKLLILNYVKRMHRRGLAVYAWTVNDRKTMENLIKVKKVDGIVTNYPDILKEVIEEIETNKSKN